VDVVIVDAPAFAAAHSGLRRLRQRSAPVYLPLLLVVPERLAGRLPDGVWEEFDEVLTTPVRQDELRLRLRRLLALREQSAQAARSLVELGRSNADLRQFAYAAAHELSNPLTVVTGVIDTIAAGHRDVLRPEAAELLAVAQRESNRLRRLIGDLLSYAQVDAVAEFEQVDLAALVGEVLGTLARQLEATGAVVDVGELPEVAGVPSQLQLVVANLIANALKYRHPARRPRIRVAGEETESHWLVSVADNGVGIAPGQATAVFDMFARGHADGRRDGYGIGLALCRRAIERHGGEIWAEPAPGHGTVFRFMLPKPDPGGAGGVRNSVAAGSPPW
jgi:signal transduction histidine kinase